MRWKPSYISGASNDNPLGNTVLELPNPPSAPPVDVRCSKSLRKHDKSSWRGPADDSSLLVTSQTALSHTHSRHWSPFSAVETCDSALNQRALLYFYEPEQQFTLYVHGMPFQDSDIKRIKPPKRNPVFIESFIAQWVATCNPKLDIRKLSVLSTQYIYAFCKILRTVNIALYSIAIHFYNRDGECLLSGTDWILSWSRYCCSVCNVKHHAVGTRGVDTWLQVAIHNVGINVKVNGRPDENFLCLFLRWR